MHYQVFSQEHDHFIELCSARYKTSKPVIKDWLNAAAFGSISGIVKTGTQVCNYNN